MWKCDSVYRVVMHLAVLRGLLIWEGLSIDLCEGTGSPLPTVNSECLAVNNIRYQLVVGLSRERLPCVHALVRALPLVHPQL